MKVSDYMPRLYENNVEMKAIIQNQEIEVDDNLKYNIDNSFKDNFIKTATLRGIENYERIFGIIPDNSKDIEYRREQVILRLYSTIPYTYARLKEILDLYCGTNNYEIEQNINEYKLHITTHFFELSNFLSDLLKNIIPANIELQVSNVNELKIGGNVEFINNNSTYEIVNIGG